MHVRGYDPGLTGAVADIDDDAYPVRAEVADMPIVRGKTRNYLDLGAIKADLIETQPDHVWLERQQARPTDGAAAGFKCGQGFGQLEGILVGLGIPYSFVTPQAWKKVMLAGEAHEEGEDRKVASLRVARRMFPLADLGRRKDAGRAEALLITEYGRRVLLGKQNP